MEQKAALLKQFGIENLKKAFKLGFDFTKQVAVSGADGWQFTDGFSFVDELSQMPAVFKSGKDILNEIKDLDLEEKEELYAWIVAEFDIPNDEVEAWIEDILNLILTIVSLVNRHKKK